VPSLKRCGYERTKECPLQCCSDTVSKGVRPTPGNVGKLPYCPIDDRHREIADTEGGQIGENEGARKIRGIVVQEESLSEWPIQRRVHDGFGAAKFVERPHLAHGMSHEQEVRRDEALCESRGCDQAELLHIL
jgi:hypothetical protein